MFYVIHNNFVTTNIFYIFVKSKILGWKNYMVKNMNTNCFEEVDTTSLVDKVEEQLIDFLISKGLKIGNLIPKEIELAEAMGVSRTVVREALVRLKTRGVLVSKKHKGTVIKSPNIMAVIEKSMLPELLNDKALRDLFELRLVLEVGMADMVVLHVTDEDIKELEAIVACEPKKSDTEKFSIEHEVKFHSKLYEISANQTLIDFQKMLLPIFNYAYDSGLIDKPIVKKKYMSHKGLVEVLKLRKPSRFRKALYQHLYNHYQRLGY